MLPYFHLIAYYWQYCLFDINDVLLLQNRCRLAEKRVDSRDSPMRDDRCLTGGLVEWKAEENMCHSKSPSNCQKSCDESDNSSNDLDRKSLKRCRLVRHLFSLTSSYFSFHIFLLMPDYVILKTSLYISYLILSFKQSTTWISVE